MPFDDRSQTLHVRVILGTSQRAAVMQHLQLGPRKALSDEIEQTSGVFVRYAPHIKLQQALRRDPIMGIATVHRRGCHRGAPDGSVRHWIAFEQSVDTADQWGDRVGAIPWP